MRSIYPEVFEAWIGGYLGPSYHLLLSDAGITYKVYEYAYELHSTEVIVPSSTAWSRFFSTLDQVEVWSWQKVYKAEASCDPTTWYLSIAINGRKQVCRGINMFAPGFVEYLRSVRGLLDGRPFA